jgi:hypothetical protein
MELSKDLKLSKNKKNIKSLFYGNLGYFRPNIDNTKFKFVTKKEADNYENFVRNYNNYWKDYFDPIGIRISTQNNKILIDTHILPLINSSMYQMVQKIIGGKGVILGHKKLPSEWFNMSLKLSRSLKEYLPKIYREFYREFRIPQNKEINFMNIIGNHITFSILDSSPLVDFNISALISDIFTRRSRNIGFLAFLATSLAHPIRITLPLKGDFNILKTETERFINYLTKYSIDRDITWNAYKKLYKNQKYMVLTLKLWNMITFRGYFMFTKNALELTTTENYLKKIIDLSNRKHIHPDNKTIKEHKQNLKSKRNISLSFYPNSIKLEKEYFTNMLIDNLIEQNLKNIRTFSLIQSIYKKQLSQKDFYKMFNFNINPPLDEKYIYQNNTITHPILFGYRFKTLNMNILKKKLLNNYYNLKKTQIEFEFTNTGIDTRITIE